MFNTIIFMETCLQEHILQEIYLQAPSNEIFEYQNVENYWSWKFYSRHH